MSAVLRVVGRFINEPAQIHLNSVVRSLSSHTENNVPAFGNNRKQLVGMHSYPSPLRIDKVHQTKPRNGKWEVGEAAQDVRGRRNSREQQRHQ